MPEEHLMKKLAEDEDAVVGVELVTEVVEVEVAVGTVHIRIRHADIAVRVRPPKCQIPSGTPPVEYSPG